MSDDALVTQAKEDVQWYADEIPVRGCKLTLGQFKSAYRELAALTKKEADRIVDSLVKPEEMSDDDHLKRKNFLKEDAFQVTVSIMGFDGETAYGATEAIFDSKNLPLPIKTVYFTNTTAFNRHSNGAEPPNHFSVWVHFDKPPLFDPNPLVSEPTRNASLVRINADDVGYFRAVQNIVGSRLKSKKKWYSFLHEKFAYDIGLWFLALPYALYWTTIYADYLFPAGSRYASFWIAFYIYGLGSSLLIYRSLFGYLKWAFPLNVLEENNDSATRHRVLLGAILSSIVISGVKSLLNTIIGV